MCGDTRCAAGREEAEAVQSQLAAEAAARREAEERGAELGRDLERAKEEVEAGKVNQVSGARSPGVSVDIGWLVESRHGVVG